jgi:hypothetical protein
VNTEREVTPATLERLLETRFAATGASLSEKLASVETKLPAPLLVQLRAVFATARQLETGGTVDIGSYRRTLHSCAEQLELLGAPMPQPSPPAPPALEPVAAPPKVPRIGTQATPRAPRVSRLQVWLYETRQRIQQRAHRASRTWRVPGTLIGLIGGGVAGWFLAGIGGAVALGVLLGAVTLLGLSESAIARGLWLHTRAVEGLFALLRLLGRAALAVLAIVVVGLIVFFVTRFWNVR